MSYARWSDESSVYVFAHVNGGVQCCGCILNGQWDFYSADEVVAHMKEHVAAGHQVPERLLDVALYRADSFKPREELQR